jgi:hypothetical protein
MEEFKPKITPPSDSRHPLIHFTGVLDNYKATQEKNEQSNREYVVVTFNFTGVEVIESTEPYNFPIATIPVPYSERSSTAWAAFASSCRTLLPDTDLDLLVGKKQTWKYAATTLRRPNTEGVWGDVEGNAWQVLSLEGASTGQDVTKQVVSIAIGKTEPEFYKSVFSNESLKKLPGYGEIVESVVDRTLVDKLTQMGLIKVVDGVITSA